MRLRTANLRRFAALGQIVLTSTGCAATNATSTARSWPAPRAAVVRFEAPLTFEAAGGKPLPVPMLEATIAGARTRLIVDTGASDHVLTSAFASAHGLRTAPAMESGRDHAGAELQAVPLRALSLELANTTLPFEGFVIDGPPPFEVLGIGGFVSPQRLSGAGYVVLDFPRSRLVALDGDEAEVTRWLAAYGEPAAVSTTWSRNKPFVEVALAPRGTVLGELDTGGSGSEVSAAYAGEQAESAARVDEGERVRHVEHGDLGFDTCFKSNVAYLISRDSGWGLTDEDLADPKFNYLRSLV